MYPTHRFHIQCPIFPMLAVSGGFDLLFSMFPSHLSQSFLPQVPCSEVHLWFVCVAAPWGLDLGCIFQRFFYPVVGLYQGPLWMVRAESLARGSLLLNWREGWTVGFSMAFWGQVDLFPKDPQGWMDRLPKRHWGTMHRFLEGLCTEGQTLGGPLGQSTVTFWGPQFYLGFSWTSIHSCSYKETIALVSSP